MAIEIRVNKILGWDELGDQVLLIASPSGTFRTGVERLELEFWSNRDSDKFDKINLEAIDVAVLERAFHDKDYVGIEINKETRKILSVRPATINIYCGIG